MHHLNTFSGVVPPNKRNESQLDPGAMYHVAANIGYVRYFVAIIYQYQFFEAMCKASGHYDPEDPKRPLHMCNFYGNHVITQLQAGPFESISFVLRI